MEALVLCALMNVFVVACAQHCVSTDGFDEAERSLQLAIDVLNLVKEESKHRNNVSTTASTAVHVTETNAYTSPTTIGPRRQSLQSLPSNCAELQRLGYSESGVYEVFPKWQTMKANGIKVYCDMETEGGGWMLLQRRDASLPAPRQSFNQSWQTYSEGFGNLCEEFWLGNDLIYNLTHQEWMTLRVELEDWDGSRGLIQYLGLFVGDEEESYHVQFQRYFFDVSTTDGFFYLHEKNFSTPDRDYNSLKLATKYGAGFWFGDTSLDPLCNINGVSYPKDERISPGGMFWKDFHGLNYSLMKTEMKIRPMVYVPPLTVLPS